MVRDAGQRLAAIQVRAAVGDRERAQPETGCRDAGDAGRIRLVGRGAVADQASIRVRHVVEIAAGPAFDLVEQFGARLGWVFSGGLSIGIVPIDTLVPARVLRNFLRD